MGEHKFRNKRPSYKGKKSRAFVTIVIIAIVVVGVVAYDMINRGGKNPLNDFIPERTKGSPTAPLKIVEFIDLQCTHCKHGSETLKEYMTKYPEGIQLTMRFFPLGSLNSSMSAYYAQCASRQGKFWPMLERLLETQDSWRDMLRPHDYFAGEAATLGLDVPALQQCVENKEVRAIVGKDKTLGESYFVKSTPTYFINGEMTVGVKKLEEELQAFFEKKSASPM